VQKGDVTVAKNYLNSHEINELNRIVVMWLDFAEDKARRCSDHGIAEIKEQELSPARWRRKYRQVDA